MKRGIGRRGFSPSEELIWFLAQVIGALIFTVILTGYVDSAVRGGLLAKQFYPGNFGLLETVVASSPDNMVMGDFVEKFKDTEFSFTGSNNRIEVTANTLKAPSRFWVFTPETVATSAFTITPATGVVHAVKEGNQVTLRKGDDFQFNVLTCPHVDTADSNGLARKNVIVLGEDSRVVGALDARKVLGDVSARAGALLGVGSSTGTTIKLAIDPVIADKTRIVAYYNPHASEDIQLKSIKLGCTIVNGFAQSVLGEKIDGIAVLPGTMAYNLPKDQPSVVIVIGQLGAKQPTLTDLATTSRAMFDGVKVYYG